MGCAGRHDPASSRECNLAIDTMPFEHGAKAGHGGVAFGLGQRPDGARGHQNITKQVRRNPDEATVMKQPEVGKGIEL